MSIDTIYIDFSPAWYILEEGIDGRESVPMRIAREAEVESFLSEVFSILNKFPKDRDLKRKGELWLFGKLLNPPRFD